VSGADEAELLRLHAGLAIATYYDFLGLRPGCDYVAVREAFHARAQRYHPDRFVVGGDAERRQLAYEVYKRMTEAYQVLCDPELRAAYDEARLRGRWRGRDGWVPTSARCRTPSRGSTCARPGASWRGVTCAARGST
jgi:curved DNA-binding protein CbpA